MIIEAILGSITALTCSSLWFAKGVMKREDDREVREDIMLDEAEQKKEHLAEMNRIEVERNKVRLEAQRVEVEHQRNAKPKTTIEVEFERIAERRKTVESFLMSYRSNGMITATHSCEDELRQLVDEKNRLLQLMKK